MNKILNLSFLCLLCIQSKVMSQQGGPVQPMVHIPSSPIASSLGKYAEYPVSLNTGTVSISVPLYTIKSKSLQLPISLSYHSSGIKVNDKVTNVGLGWSLNAGGVINRTLKGVPDEYNLFSTVVQADTLEYFGNAQKMLDDPMWEYTGPDQLRRAHVLSFGVDEQYLDARELARKRYLDNIIRFKSVDSEPDRFSYNFNGRSGFFMYDNNGEICTSDRAPIKVDLDINLQNGNDTIEITTEDGTLYRFGRDSQGNAVYEKTLTGMNPTPSHTSYRNIDYVSSWYLAEVISANKLDTISLKYHSYNETETFYSQQFSMTVDEEMMNTNVPLEIIKCSDLKENTTMVTRNTKYLNEIYFKNGKVVFNHVQDRQDIARYRLANLDIYKKENGNYAKIEQIVLDNDHYFQRDNLNLSKTYVPGQLKSLKLKKVLLKNVNGDEKGSYAFLYNNTNLPPRNSYAQDYWGYYNGENQNTSLVPQATYANCPEYIIQTSHVNRDASGIHMKASVLEEIKYPSGGRVRFEYEPHYIKETTTEQDIITYSKEASALGLNPTMLNMTHRPIDLTQFTFPVGQFSDVRISYELSGYFREVGDNEFNYIKLIDVTNNDATVFLLEHYGTNEPQGQNNTKSGTTNLSLEKDHIYKLETYTGNSSLKSGGMSILGTSYASATIRWDNVVNTQNIIAMPIGGLRIQTIKYFEDSFQNGPSFMKRYDYGVESYQNHGVGRLLYNHKNNQTRSISLDVNGSFYEYSISHSEPVDILTNMGSAVEYDQITEYYSGTNGFKTVYTYSPSHAVFSGLPLRNSPYGNTALLSYPAWEQGILKSKQVYSENNGNYTLVSHKTHNYTNLGTKTIKALKAQTLSRSGNEGTLGIVAFNYNILLGKKALSSTSLIQYSPNGDKIGTTITSYEYEPNFFLQENTTVNTSIDNETIKTTTVYPHTITNPSSIESNLKNAHRLALPLEVHTYKLVGVTEEPLTSQKTIYKDWGSNSAGTANIISLEKIQSIKRGSTSNQLINEAIYYDYDDWGNAIDVSRYGGPHTYYIWGYNNTYPIAKLKNFESSQLTEPLQILFDAAVAASNTDEDHCKISTCTEELLRNALKNIHENSALSNIQISTYTYDLLIGVTSMTDPRGYTIYYEYDDFNRLKEVKDAVGNLVTDYKYHYADTQQN